MGALGLAGIGLSETVGAASMAGSGTFADPYIVTTVDQLQSIRDDPYAVYELGNDIDASSTSTWDGGAGFEPIGRFVPFQGSFDGKGYTISDLTIDTSSSFSGDGTGLFGKSSGTIRNVALSDIDVTGSVWTGGVVGIQGPGGTVTDSSSTGTIKGVFFLGGIIGLNNGSVSRSKSAATITGQSFSSGVGGLVGGNEVVQGSKAAIRESFATGAVSGKISVGGLVGGNGGAIRDAFATGAVSGDSSVGGLVGDGHGVVSDVYAAGTVSGDSSVGGLIGQSFQTYSDAYWDTQTSGQSTSAGGPGVEGLTTAQMTGTAARTHMDGLDFTDTWYTTASYPQLSVFQSAITVDVDVLPDSEKNPIVPDRPGRLPVAVLGTETFDATDIDVSTVTVEGATPLNTTFEDVNDDGIDDLLVFVSVPDLDIDDASTSLTVTGTLEDETAIEGTDAVSVVGRRQ